MPFSSQTTADLIMGAVEALVVKGSPADANFIAEFLGTTPANAGAALEMGVELGLLFQNGTTFETKSPLCRLTAIPEQKAAVLRILIECYQPYTVFRERLLATADLNGAAHATKTVCNLPAHRDAVKETLLSLATFSRALIQKGGGNYQLDRSSLVNALQVMALAAKDMAAAEGRIRDQLGPVAAAQLEQHRDTIILPLADALIRANNRDGAGAVQAAGNAIESHITELANRMGVGLTGTSGIIEKLNRFSNPRRLPRKLIQVGTYLGAIRNAADHGPDVDINNLSWRIRVATGLEYVFVSCSFIAATVGVEKNNPPEI